MTTVLLEFRGYVAMCGAWSRQYEAFTKLSGASAACVKRISQAEHSVIVTLLRAIVDGFRSCP